MAEYQIDRVLLVINAELAKLGVHRPFIEHLQVQGAHVLVFDAIEATPTQGQIEAAIKTARDLGLNGVLALGGESLIAAARIVALVLTKETVIPTAKGGHKVKKRPLPLIAVPITPKTEP